MKKKNKKVYLDVTEIPPKINEIISYLSMDFSKNKLMEREDLVQDLYVIYLSMIKKNPKLKKALPGYFFIKFKWYLLTLWKKKKTHINKEWAYKLQQTGVLNSKQAESYSKDKEEDPKFKLKRKKNKKYAF